MDLVPGMDLITLMGVDQDITVKLLHSFFAFVGKHPAKPPPPVVEIQVESFVVRRSVRAVPRADHIIHIEGVAQTLCQPILCK